ncbi:hypothetical protein L1987_72131 [Smallanthus sonchifolius]|uniref:Uncharacterized protein n=1 Tax=Smallanthus sonchifolius TaxID=185202 RepID=A0ACB9ATS9_9ASTR|nr:hypothetical protein L1987_72131 [Smallanthus sonchifolius]
MLIPGDVNILESSTGLYTDVSDGNNVGRVDTSEHACTSSRCLDDAGAIVEELTVRNYSSGNLETGREDRKPASCNTLVSPSAIRTKMLSQSGFSQYFVKNTLKGKGVICSGPGPAGDALVHIRGRNHPKAPLMDCNSAPDSSKEITGHPTSVHEALSLREWLKSGQNKVDKSKSMHIFNQILDLVHHLMLVEKLC